MAEKRMFTKKVTDDDNFMTLSSSAQALYLHLAMSADDDGFSNQVNISMYKAHASIQDLQALLEKRYIYQFDSGVIVIKHWRMANALRKDRYTETAFKEELAQLDIKDNGSYTWLPNGCQMVDERLPNGCHSIDKCSVDKCSIGEGEKPQKRFTPPTFEEVKAYCEERRNNVDAEHFINHYDANGWKVGKNNMKDWKAAVRSWEKNGFNNQSEEKNDNRRNYDLDKAEQIAKTTVPALRKKERR